MILLANGKVITRDPGGTGSGGDSGTGGDGSGDSGETPPDWL